MSHKFEGMLITPLNDLKAGKENDGEILFTAGKEYEVLHFSDIPNPFCFIVINNMGCFDTVHMTNFKLVKREK